VRPGDRTAWDERERKRVNHLDVDGFIGVRVGERRRGEDERHDAHPVVHQRHVGDDDAHDDLSGDRKEGGEDGEQQAIVNNL